MKNDPSQFQSPPRPKTAGEDSAAGASDRAGEGFAVAGLTLLAALLRFPFLSRFGLWLDEIYIRKQALEPPADNLNTVHFVHFLAVKPGLALWDSPFGLRLASACFGVLVVPLAFYGVRRTLGRTPALLFAFCLAVVPYFINYSIDANYYSHVIFWTVAGLATAFGTYERPRLWPLLPLGVFGLIAFFVHPFSAAFFASTALVMILAVVGRRRKDVSRAASEPPGRRRARYAGYGLAGLMLFVLVWAMSGTSAGQELIRVAERFADMIEAGESPTNIEFSFGFFENYFRRIGPAYYVLEGGGRRGRMLMTGATAVLFTVFCAGLWVMRRRPWQIATVALPFVLSFAVIFNLKAERHFNLRYFSALVPLYWLSIAAALGRVGEALAGRFASGGAGAKRSLLKAAPFAALLLLFIPQYAHLGLTDGRNWDEVMPEIADRIEADEPIVYTNWAEETMLPHYQKLYGLEGVPRIKLPHTEKRNALTAAILRDLCYRSPRLWFISSWLAIQSPEAVAWAGSKMETVSQGESIFAEHYNVTAYHWKWGGRYVLAPRILPYSPDATDFTTEGFSQRFLVETPLRYRIEAVLRTDAVASGLELTVDGQRVPLSASEDARKEHTVWVGETKLAGGEHEVALEGASAGQLKTLRFVPVYPNGAIPVSPADVSEFYPSDYVWAPDRDGETWLCLKRNTFASARFGVPRPGIYELITHGLNDRPAPVWIELRLDGDALGVIQFERGDGSEGTRRFPLRLTRGNHTLTARFLNEGNVQSADPAVDRDAWIRGFQFRPLNAPRRDDRVYVPRRGWARIGLARPGETELAADWSTVTDGDLHPELSEADVPGGKAWKATLPRNSKGLLLKSPVLPVPPERVVYVSGLVRTEGLLNHSANMKVYFLDGSGGRIGETVVNQEGIYRTTDWVRFVEFQPVPEEIAYFQTLFWVYPNSRRPSLEAGTAFFGDLRVETGGAPARTDSAP